MIFRMYQCFGHQTNMVYLYAKHLCLKSKKVANGEGWSVVEISTSVVGKDIRVYGIYCNPANDEKNLQSLVHYLDQQLTTHAEDSFLLGDFNTDSSNPKRWKLLKWLLKQHNLKISNSEVTHRRTGCLERRLDLIISPSHLPIDCWTVKDTKTDHLPVLAQLNKHPLKWKPKVTKKVTAEEILRIVEKDNKIKLNEVITLPGNKDRPKIKNPNPDVCIAREEIQKTTQMETLLWKKLKNFGRLWKKPEKKDGRIQWKMW
eukprot:GHVP01006704.1.p1 GENE.GHVP01006704.1~~GHVP01006704.1.p1  ORF type:complete len:259 (-),score=38.80 GHVP01006704.1:525-1301(-)